MGTWTGLHSHLCQVGKEEVCRGGGQTPSTWNLGKCRSNFLMFLPKYSESLPITRMALKSDQNYCTSQSWTVSAGSSTTKLETSQIERAAYNISTSNMNKIRWLDGPRKKWSEILKVLSPCSARIIPPWREAWRVMSLVTGRLAWGDIGKQSNQSEWWISLKWQKHTQ